MAIKFRFGKYEVKMTCPNCGFGNEALIPKGTRVNEFVQTGSFKCDNCGCLEQPKSYVTKWLK